MSYDLTAFTEEFWARQMQVIFFKENVAIALANTDFREILNAGDTLNKPYRSHLVVKTYTKATDIVSQDVSGTNEQLSVNTAKVVPFYVDDIDALQNKWDMAMQYASDAQRMLNNVLDQVIAGEYSNATSDVDDGDVGGTDGSAIAITTSNIQQVFTAASRKLDQLNIPQRERFALIGPRILEVIRLYIGGKDTAAADLIGDNGKVMERFGFKLYYSNNLAFTATWTPIDNPTNAATISIAGVDVTFVDTIGTTAGNCHIGGTTAATLDNLVNLLTGIGGGTAGTDYVEFSDANRYKLQSAGIVATDGTTTLGIVGYGDIVVATSEALDLWSVQYQHMLCGMKGATDLVIQKTPNVEFRKAEKRLGRYVYPWMLYGYKTFADMKDALVDVKIDASSWT